MSIEFEVDKLKIGLFLSIAIHFVATIVICGMIYATRAVHIEAGPEVTKVVKPGDEVKHKLSGDKALVLGVNEDGSYHVVWGGGHYPIQEASNSPALLWEKN